MTQASVSSEPVSHPLIGTEIGKYRLVRLLGRGGMGSVFEAVHNSIGQRVAVKVLNAAFSEEPEILQRFFIEARASSLVQHPGLVQIFDHGTMETGRAYLLMEYLEGVSLRQHLRQRKQLAPEEALLLMRLVASAVGAAHEKGIIHRDLKPENIFLIADSAAPGGVRPKVLDFGIAKLDIASESDSGLRTTTGALLGTPAYMSPEQCRAGSLTTKSDVYSLGIMLFQLLIGETPFGDAASGEVYARHLYEIAPRLRSRAPALPADLDELVAAMLSKDPDERPTMAQVEAALNTATGGSQVVVLSGLSGAWRWEGRRARLRGLARRPHVQLGLLLLAAVLSATLTIWIWPSARAPRVPPPPTPAVVVAKLPPPPPPLPVTGVARPVDRARPERVVAKESDKPGKIKKPRNTPKEEEDSDFQVAR